MITIIIIWCQYKHCSTNSATDVVCLQSNNDVATL